MTRRLNRLLFFSLQINDGILPEIDLKGHSIEDLAAFANVSVNVIKAAISMRQSQMIQKRKTDLRNQSIYSSPSLITTTERMIPKLYSPLKQIEQGNKLVNYNFKTHKVSQVQKLTIMLSTLINFSILGNERT